MIKIDLVNRVAETSQVSRVKAALAVDTIFLADPTPDENTASNLVWAQFPAGGDPTTGRVTIWVEPEEKS